MEAIQEKVEVSSMTQTGSFEPAILAFCCEH